MSFVVAEVTIPPFTPPPEMADKAVLVKKAGVIALNKIVDKEHGFTVWIDTQGMVDEDRASCTRRQRGMSLYEDRAYRLERHSRKVVERVVIPLPDGLSAADVHAPEVRSMGEMCCPPIPALTEKPSVNLVDVAAVPDGGWSVWQMGRQREVTRNFLAAVKLKELTRSSGSATLHK